MAFKVLVIFILTIHTAFALHIILLQRLIAKPASKTNYSPICMNTLKGNRNISWHHYFSTRKKNTVYNPVPWNGLFDWSVWNEVLSIDMKFQTDTFSFSWVYMSLCAVWLTKNYFVLHKLTPVGVIWHNSSMPPFFSYTSNKASWNQFSLISVSLISFQHIYFSIYWVVDVTWNINHV